MTAAHADDAPRRLMVLSPSPFDGRGPSATCTHLLDGFVAAGRDAHLFANRYRTGPPSFGVTTAIPRFVARAPYKYLHGAASRWTERRYLAALRPGDVAYLWPDASLPLHRRLRERGAYIVQEAINSRMGYAKPILDAAYARIGLPPSHTITQRRIDEEEAKYALSDAIFCPSPQTEIALDGTGLDLVRVGTSYGTDFDPALTHSRPDPGAGGRIVFLFVGFACVRKGVDRLLELWGRLPPNYVLRLVGEVEGVVRDLYGPALAAGNVEAPGYSRDIPGEMARANVFIFPSVEEGGPQVTYEAANAGLPIVTTFAGGGRFLEEQDCAIDVSGLDDEAILAALVRLGASHEERMDRGRTGREAARRYDWGAIAARRSADLAAVTAAEGRRPDALAG